jgi:SulP family sulfate permease
LAQIGVTEAIGEDALHESKGAAIAAILPSLDPSRCATCTARIFRECPTRAIASRPPRLSGTGT